MFRLLIKPPHGWNAVAWELGIVTLGVLIALGAQEVVQSVHWTREVRETRQALDAELSRDLAVFDQTLSQTPCIDRRTDELRRWAESFRTGNPLKLKHEILPPAGFMIRTEAWEISDGEIASRIPLQSRLNYAGLYSSMRTFRDLKAQTDEPWEVLAEYDGSTALSEGDIRRIVQATKDVKSAAAILPAFQTTIDRHARGLGLKPDPNLLKTANPLIAQISTAACEPYL